ncbi:hypothetical protein scyTo_0015349 [Scyliorhinus torazame]|uniref:Phorbol-ester/DAG-type domain-containing protein n=1 Tax=Scyliorhinus torazame TaxID=75743 RepID=A0A401PR51_SCYTO|nr:hypothetical protein [Scyliorhinus torazame]
MAKALAPEELASSSHTFKNKTFKKPKTCNICKQLISSSQGLSCRVCKYACHKKCEPKVSQNKSRLFHL